MAADKISRKRSAGVVIIRNRGGQRLFLLLRAYDHWDFPKGRLEPGEDFLDAALREVKEETGLEGLDFLWGHGFAETEPYSQGKIARYYVAESKGGDVVLGVNPELGRPEHHEFRWMTYQEAHPLLVPRIQKVLDWARSVVLGTVP